MREAAIEAVERVRRGLRRRAHDRGHDDDPRGARGASSPTFKHTEAVLTFQSGFTANTGVIPTITGETDLIVSDELNHASIIDGMRLSKAPRKVFPHADVDGLREVLREAPRAGPRRHGDAVPPDPRRDRRRVLHGRRHRAAARASSRRPRRTAPRCWSTTRTRRGVLGTDGRGSVNHFGLDGRVAIQVGTLSKAVGVARRLRRRLAGAARHPHPARAAVPVLDVATRRPSPPPAARRSGSCQEEPRAPSSGCGRTPAGSRPSSPASGFDTGRSRDADHARDPGRRARRRSGSPAGCSRRACSRRPWCSRPSPSTRRGSGRS